MLSSEKSNNLVSIVLKTPTNENNQTLEQSKVSTLTKKSKETRCMTHVLVNTVLRNIASFLQIYC